MKVNGVTTGNIHELTKAVKKAHKDLDDKLAKIIRQLDHIIQEDNNHGGQKTREGEET